MSHNLTNSTSHSLCHLQTTQSWEMWNGSNPHWTTVMRLSHSELLLTYSPAERLQNISSSTTQGSSSCSNFKITSGLGIGPPITETGKTLHVSAGDNHTDLGLSPGVLRKQEGGESRNLHKDTVISINPQGQSTGEAHTALGGSPR